MASNNPTNDAQTPTDLAALFSEGDLLYSPSDDLHATVTAVSRTAAGSLRVHVRGDDGVDYADLARNLARRLNDGEILRVETDGGEDEVEIRDGEDLSVFVDGAVLHDLARSFGMGAGGLKGLLRFPSPSRWGRTETRAVEAAIREQATRDGISRDAFLRSVYGEDDEDAEDDEDDDDPTYEALVESFRAGIEAAVEEAILAGVHPSDASTLLFSKANEIAGSMWNPVRDEDAEIVTDGGVDLDGPLDASALSPGDCVELDLADGRTVRVEVGEEWAADEVADLDAYATPSREAVGKFPGREASVVYVSNYSSAFEALPRYRATLVLDAASQTAALVSNWRDGADRGYVSHAIRDARVVGVADRWEVEGAVGSSHARHVLRVLREAFEDEDGLFGWVVKPESILVRGADASGTGVFGDDLGLTIHVLASMDLQTEESLDEFLFANLNDGVTWEKERTGVYTFYREAASGIVPLR